MAHAARIENGIVVQVVVVPNDLDENESDAAIQQYLNNIGLYGEWVRTSYNANIRGKFAGIGDIWDGQNFISTAITNDPDPA